MREETFAIGSEADRTPCTSDQFHSECVLKTLDVSADRGLSQMQHAGRLVKAAALSDSHQAAQRHDVQRFCHTSR